MQLMHETVGKEGKGQTMICADAPDSQHHTNQRFFGGRKDMMGLFLTVENQDSEITLRIPETVKDIPLRDGTIENIDGIPLARSIEYEFKGTWEDAISNKIPVARISLDRITPESIGELTAFWHYVAVYSAALRGLNPFDQPQVESSKAISFRLRKLHDK